MLSPTAQRMWRCCNGADESGCLPELPRASRGCVSVRRLLSGNRWRCAAPAGCAARMRRGEIPVLCCKDNRGLKATHKFMTAAQQHAKTRSIAINRQRLDYPFPTPMAEWQSFGVNKGSAVSGYPAPQPRAAKGNKPRQGGERQGNAPPPESRQTALGKLPSKIEQNTVFPFWRGAGFGTAVHFRLEALGL